MSGFRVPVLEKFSWQEPVISFVTAVPASPVKGDRYVVGTAATGAFAGHDGHIAWYNGVEWKFDIPTFGWNVFNTTEKSLYSYQETGWSNKQIISGLKLNGDIESADTAVKWILKDNDPNALTFKVGTADGPSMVNFDTTDGKETMTINADAVITGGLHVQGQVTSVESTNLVVEDALITVNKNGDATTARGAGIEVEAKDGETDLTVGYIKTTGVGKNAGFDFLAPGSDKTFTIQLESDVTDNVVVSLKENLSVLAECIIDQNLQTTADVKFKSVTTTADATVGGKLTVTGDETVSGAATIVKSLTVGDGVTAAPATLNGDLTVNGASALNGNVDLNGSLSVSNTIVDASNGNAVTVEQIRKAYDSRAIYDRDLECIVFDSDRLDYISTAAPTLTAFNPASGGTPAPTATFAFTFSDNVKAGTGTIKFIDASSAAVVEVDVTSAAVTFNGAVMSVNLASTPLTAGLVYGVEIAAGAVKSSSDVAFAGLTYNPAQYSVTVTA